MPQDRLPMHRCPQPEIGGLNLRAPPVLMILFLSPGFPKVSYFSGDCFFSFQAPGQQPGRLLIIINEYLIYRAFNYLFSPDEDILPSPEVYQ
jgi:hypothetical protein